MSDLILLRQVPDPTLTSVAVDVATLPNDGSTPCTVTVTVRDRFGRPMPRAEVEVSVSGTGATVTHSRPRSDASGQAVASFVASVAEAKTVSVTVNGVAITETQAVTVEESAAADEYAIRAPLSSDMFLDPTAGSDGDGTEASPWNVFTSAKVNTLSAGQVLWIKDGTFNWASLTSLPSGTSTDRIKIAAYPGHSPVATLPSNASDFDGSAGFGHASGASYWDLVGLHFNLAGHAGIVFGAVQWNHAEIACDHVRIIDCTGNMTLAASDNGAILFFDPGADHWEVIRGAYTATGATGGSGTNRALIWTDYTRHFKIIGALLDAEGTSLPFYFKHTNLQTEAEVERVLRNNIIRNGSRGVFFCGKYFQITNNVFDNTYLEFGDQGGGDVGRGECSILHNTFKDSIIGFTINDAGGEPFDNLLRDNVMAGSGEALHDNPFAATDLRTLSSFNCYVSGSGRIRRSSTTYSLSGYQSAFTDRETNSIAGTITFEGGGSEGETPADWALTAGSAGESAASDGSDCGADVTKLLTVEV